MKWKKSLALILTTLLTLSLLAGVVSAEDDSAPIETGSQAGVVVPSEEPQDDPLPDVTTSAREVFYHTVLSAASVEELEQVFALYSDETIQTFLEELDEEQQTTLYQHMDGLYSSETVPDYSGISSTEAAPFLPAVQAASFFSMRDAEEENTGLILDKTAVYDKDSDSYKITLEAFVTGEVNISSVEKSVPTDIVLVLDTSGSMGDYITIGTRDNTSVLDTVYGAENIYQYNDKVAILDHWQNMKYMDGKWYYAGWSDREGEWLELGGKDNTAYGVDIRIKKIDALKIAAQRFVDQVNAKNSDSNGSSIGHQIAVVQYANDASDLIGLTNVSTGNTQIKNAITSLNATGSTSADYGMEHALKILEQIPENRESNRVVIMFTDGEPNRQWFIFGDEFETVANATIKTSQQIKATAGATVYTIGVFEDNKMDATTPMPDNVSDLNKYMHYVSSNFKNATSLTYPGQPTYPKTGSYYLGATDATQLNDIFKSISDQITTGGASITLGTDTVIKDTVAPQFTAPTNSSEIQIYTAPYQGYDNNSNRKFGERVKSNLTATIAEDGSIQVSGFDFSSNENCVTDTIKNGNTTYSGNKLIIEFTVKVKDGFLGGKNVYTNGEATVTSGTFSQEFPKPTVDVPVKDITITAETQNAYLTQVPSETDLTFTVKCGGVDITDPSNLADWQKEYVDIDTSVTFSDGFDATDDGTYTVNCTIKSTDGQSTLTSKTQKADILVYKPTLTYPNYTVYFGQAPSSIQPESITWTHNGTVAPSTMGTAPELKDITYSQNTNFTDCTDVRLTSAKIGSTEVVNDLTCDGFTVHVLQPTLTLSTQDVWADCGATFDLADKCITKSTNSPTWADKNSGHSADDAEGTAPTVAGKTFTFTPAVTAGTDGTYNITVGETDQTYTVTGTFALKDSGTTFDATFTKNEFTVHVNKFNLTVSHDGTQNAIFTLSDGTKLAVPAGKSVTVHGLICGKKYSISEDSDNAWTWRYGDAATGTITGTTSHNEVSTTDPGTGTASVEMKYGNQTNTLWLSGQNSAINCVGGLVTMDALPAKTKEEEG